MKRDRKGGEGEGEEEKQHVYYVIFIGKTKLPQLQKGRGKLNRRGGEGGGGGGGIFYIYKQTMCNQGGEKKEHRVPIMMDCVQTTN